MSAMNIRKRNKYSPNGSMDYVLANIYLTYIVGYFILFVERKVGMLIEIEDLIRAIVCMCTSCFVCILATIRQSEGKIELLLNVIVSMEVFLVSLHMSGGRILFILPQILVIGVSLLTIICFFCFLQFDQSVRKQSAEYRFRQLFAIERFFAVAACPIVLLVVFCQISQLNI